MADVDTDYSIEEDKDKTFMVVFHGKKFGYFSSKIGAETYLGYLLKETTNSCEAIKK